MKLDPIYYEYIVEGLKDYELRIYDEKRQKIKLFDSIKFINRKNKRTFKAVVTGLTFYQNFEEAIGDTGVERLLPNVKGEKKGVENYNNFPHGEGGTYKEAAEKYGVLRIKFDV